MILYSPFIIKSNIITSMYSAPINKPSKRYYSTTVIPEELEPYIYRSRRFQEDLNAWLEQLQDTSLFMTKAKEELTLGNEKGVSPLYIKYGGFRHFELKAHSENCRDSFLKLASLPVKNDIDFRALEQRFIAINTFHGKVIIDWNVFLYNCVQFGHRYRVWT